METRVDGRIDGSPGGEPFGIQVVEANEGRAVVRLPVRREHLHSEQDQRVNGGVIMTLADAAAHFAIASLLAPNEVHATVEVKVNFIRPGLPGVLEAEGRIIHKGSRMAVSEVSVTQSGKLVAKAQGTETWMTLRSE